MTLHVLTHSSTARRSSDLVEIQHADQPVVRDHRNDQFAAAVGVARDMARKGVDVIDAMGGAQPRGGAAHTLVDRDADARGFALTPPKHQLGPVDAVTARPTAAEGCYSCRGSVHTYG